MGFRLRGGTPKNMGQGIYWVQRNLANQRAAAANERRVAKLNASVEEFNNRYSRIRSNVARYFEEHGSLSVNQSQHDKLASYLESYEQARAAIEADIQNASMRDLNKLATTAKNLLVYAAKLRSEPTHWDAANKILSFSHFALEL